MNASELSTLYKTRGELNKALSRSKEYQRISVREKLLKTLPELKTIQQIFRTLTWLNEAAKRPDFPIQKSTFYGVKSAILTWTMLASHIHEWCWLQECNKGYGKIDWKVLEISPSNGSNPHPLIKLEFVIDGKKYIFHQHMEKALKDIALLEVLPMDFVEYAKQEKDLSQFTPVRTQIIWKKLFDTLEFNNWFIYDYLDLSTWPRRMRAKYPDLKSDTNCKPIVLLSGGPMVRYNNHNVCKAGELRYKFFEYALKSGFMRRYNLGLKICKK